MPRMKKKTDEVKIEDTETETATETIEEIPLIESSQDQIAEPVEDVPPREEAKTVTVRKTETETTTVDEVYKELVSILNVPQQKTDSPSLISYTPAGAIVTRYVLVDINKTLIEKSWKYYKDHTPNANAEKFLSILYNITQCDIPRIYKAVSTVALV